MQRIALIVLVLAAGCNPLAPSTNVVNTRYYAIDPKIEVETFPTTDLRVGVRPLEFARVYKEPIVYRESAHEIKIYDFDEWTELPRDAVTRALIDALTQTQRFADVGSAIAMRAPDLTLTGELRAFEADRTHGDPVARVEVRLSLRRAAGLDGGGALWSDIVRAEVPLARDDMPGLAGAISEAVAQVAEQAARAMAKVEITR